MGKILAFFACGVIFFFAFSLGGQSKTERERERGESVNETNPNMSAFLY